MACPGCQASSRSCNPVYLPAIDSVGQAAAGVTVAGVLHDPFGTPADGTAGLLPSVPLAIRPVRGQGFTMQSQGYGVMRGAVARLGGRPSLVLSTSANCVVALRNSRGGRDHRIATAYRCRRDGRPIRQRGDWRCGSGLRRSRQVRLGGGHWPDLASASAGSRTTVFGLRRFSRLELVPGGPPGSVRPASARPHVAMPHRIVTRSQRPRSGTGRPGAALPRPYPLLASATVENRR